MLHEDRSIAQLLYDHRVVRDENDRGPAPLQLMDMLETFFPEGSVADRQDFVDQSTSG